MAYHYDEEDEAYSARAECQEEAYINTDMYERNALMTTKIAPPYNGLTSWFTYEELIDEWVDMTTLPQGKIGPNLRNRLSGQAAVYKPMLDPDRLKAEDAVTYFKDTLRQYFVKGKEHVFLWRFLHMFSLRRGSQDMIYWIGKYTVAKKKLMDAWMDLLPGLTQWHPDYMNDMIAINTERVNAGIAPLEPSNPEALVIWATFKRQAHGHRFPMNDNLYTLVFIVHAELTEGQRERLVSTLELQGVTISQFTFEPIREAFIKLFCAPKSSLADPSYRTTGNSKEYRSFFVYEQGECFGTSGYWVQDDENEEEGFVEERENVFWTYDEQNEAWFSSKFKGRRFRREGNPSRKGGGKGKGGRFQFKPWRPKGKGKGKGKRGHAHYGADEWNEDYDYANFWGFKGKGKWGAGKGKSYKGKESADYSYYPNKGKAKGKGKFKGNKGKEGQEIANVAEENKEAPLQPSQNSTQGQGQAWQEDNSWDSYYGWEQGSPDWSTAWLVEHWEAYLAPAERLAQSRISESSLIDLMRPENARYVIMDLGCTRPIASRFYIERFKKIAPQYGIWFEEIPSYAKFSFANSQTATVRMSLKIHFPTTPVCTTQVDILEQGHVPILLSMGQMQNLSMKFDMTPDAIYITCEAFGLNNTLVPMSTSKHALLDLCELRINPRPYKAYGEGDNTFDNSFMAVRTAMISEEVLAKWTCPACCGDREADHTEAEGCKKQKAELATPPDDEVDDLENEEEEENQLPHERVGGCPACNGSHRKHTYQEGCKRKEPEEKEPRTKRAEGSGSRPKSDPDSRPFTTGRNLNPEGESVRTKVRITGKTAGTHERMKQSDSVVDSPEPQEESSARVEDPSLIKPALQRIHSKLSNKAELLKLHLKHYHMTSKQFRQRTSNLQIPKEIYDKYDEIIKSCEHCQKAMPQPARSRVSGMRATNFGDLVFIDHGEITVKGAIYAFLLILDAATNLLQAYACKTLEDVEAREQVREYMDNLQVIPKAICGDSKFMSKDWLSFYRTNGTKWYPCGPHTPWPNRAESAVRLFKKQLTILISAALADPILAETITAKQLVRQAAYARNISLTYGGVTPLELAFGRRPPDICDVENIILSS